MSPILPMINSNKTLAFLGLACLLPSAYSQGGSFGAKNPFSAPDAKVQYAPNRTYDLLHLELDFDVDYPNRLVTAKSINTLIALQDGTTQFRFHAGASTKVESVEINGKTAHFKRDGEGILVDTTPSIAGQKLVVAVQYHLKKSETPNGQGVGGWHWHEPVKGEPSRIGFYTNGETADTRDWAVTWDYPNDFATTETHTTVPSDWQVVGNGLQASDTPVEGGKRHTVVWKLDQPHATYLVSLVGGPFDIHRDKWRGVPLMYVAPKGMGDKLDYSFGHTKDILSFYSDKLGVKYPWPKYAQDITYDFGGGQENVSATTYGVFLTDAREDRSGMDWIIAHETGHQWFGDYVTCKDWGQIWLNESFATFMEMSYTLHSRGINESLREVEQNSQEYFEEAKRYKRPLATNFYQNPDVMFDQHTYPKGGVLLYSLRRQLGEKAFYAGLKRYLDRHHNGPVESNDLCADLTEATGVNLHPWFDQWIYKPGHPIIDWSWSWEQPKKEIVVKVKQTQDLSIGTPVYDVLTHVGILNIGSSTIERNAIHLNAASQEFRIPSTEKPSAVVFDPDHEFLREIPSQPWAPDELLAVLKLDPNPIDRTFALQKLIDSKPTDKVLQNIIGVLSQDQGTNPGILNTRLLATLKRAELTSFWINELKHESYQRRSTAASALGDLPKTPEIIESLKALINDKQPYVVVTAAIESLSKLDFAAGKPLIVKVARSETNGPLRQTALSTLASNEAPEAADLIFDSIHEKQPLAIRSAGYQALSGLKKADPRLTSALRVALKSGISLDTVSAARIAGDKKIKELVSDLEAAKKLTPEAVQLLEEAIKKIKA